jgi:hypothetical protein
MTSTTENAKGIDRIHALVQLLRTRSYEEIRQRMYDNPPGSPWWSACKTELDIRNGEQMAQALLATSRVLEKMRSSTEHYEKLTETLTQTTSELNDLTRDAKLSGRRLEIATYVLIGVVIVQLFYMTFQFFGKH